MAQQLKVVQHVVELCNPSSERRDLATTWSSRIRVGLTCRSVLIQEAVHSRVITAEVSWSRDVSLFWTYAADACPSQYGKSLFYSE
jgi:hypothetical protein